MLRYMMPEADLANYRIVWKMDCKDIIFNFIQLTFSSGFAKTNTGHFQEYPVTGARQLLRHFRS